MAAFDISLPDQTKAWVEKQVREGRYADASAYVQDLIRRDQEREAAHDDLMVEIQKGLDSGVSPRSPREIWEASRAKARAAKAA